MELIFSAIGCIVGLGALMYCMYKGANTVAAVPLCALLVVVFSGMPVVETMLDTFTGGFANMVKVMVFIFLSGTMFGKCLIESGSAYVIADWIADTFGAEKVCWAVVIGVGILSYGGMGWGSYVTMFPIGHILCSKANYNRNILIGSILCGSWTFAMTGPLAPTAINGILMSAFGTTSTAGLVPGLAASAVMLFGGCFYLDWQVKRWRANGKVFDSQEFLEKETSSISERRPHLIVAFIPIIFVLILFNAFQLQIPVAMFLGAILCILINFNAFTPSQWFGVINRGCYDGLVPMINLTIMGGFGAVVSATPFFSWFVQILENSSAHPYILAVLVGQATAFLLGSASSAAVLTINTVGPLLIQSAQIGGYSLGNIHRLIALSAGGLDSMPNNGSIVSMNSQFGTKHSESYFPVFITCTVIPIIAVVCIALPLAMLGFK